MNAIEAMKNALKESTSPITIVAIGPLTNIALLLATYPEIKSKIKQIVIMGGSCGRGNVTPLAEFNIYCDPEAANIVFNSQLQLVMIGLDLARQAMFSHEFIEKIKSGELVVLLGPNGAGKSTLFSIITGLVRADTGECFINGNNIADNSIEALKSLGVVFQQPTIDLELTIKENLLFHSRLHGIEIGAVKKVIEDELTNTGLLKKINNKVRTLSGGERRKVELIRSLLHNPKMLLMDEPTVGLDPSSRVDLLKSKN